MYTVTVHNAGTVPFALQNPVQDSVTINGQNAILTGNQWNIQGNGFLAVYRRRP